jgi:hypothetical protein
MHKPFFDRRRGPDFWVVFTRYLAILGWALFIVAMVISFYAAPETNYGILRYYRVEVRTSWVRPLTDYLYVILWFNAALSFASFVINSYRSRRASDSKYFNLVLLFLVSVAWVVYIYISVN